MPGPINITDMKKIIPVSLLLWTAFAGPVSAAEGSRPTAGGAEFSFVPNQCRANWWYRPAGELINGHLDESFGDAGLWPQLLANLKQSGGPFSMFAPEVAHLSSGGGLLAVLQSEGIPLSVELPGFTQCILGRTIAEAELYGRWEGGDHVMYGGFPQTHPRGWFVTAGGTEIIPDQILFDERQPNLCTEIDPVILARTEGSWEERLEAAKKYVRCDRAMLPWTELLPALRQDYIDYLALAREKWGDRMPSIGIHWNVVMGWEWRDQRALTTINEMDSTLYCDPARFYSAASLYPQYNSVGYCNELVDALTAAGFKPDVVLMDVDWLYDIPYITEVLRRHKTQLGARGVQMGINIVEAGLPHDEELVFDGVTLLRRRDTQANPNILHENTLVAIVEYLIASGIYEPGMQMRVGSWEHRPYETGREIDERREGSMAHTANRIYDMLWGGR